MNNKDLRNYLVSNSIKHEENVSLKKRTWIHRGGNASFYITPQNEVELIKLTRYLYSKNIQFTIVGHTSNLYIRNTTNIDVYISTSRCKEYRITNDFIECEAGVAVQKLSLFAIQEGMKGFENLIGLPGTIGGAIVNNSSCNGNSISDLLISVNIITDKGLTQTLTREQLKFKYRTSIFKERKLNATIISAKLKIVRGDKDELERLAKHNKLVRSEQVESGAHNLGCTVNLPFSLGKMPFKYKICASLLNKILKLVKVGAKNRNEIIIKMLCYFSGYKSIEKYISKKNPIIFMWLDDNADAVFPEYLKFMKDLYKTDHLEIEIL